MDWSACPDCNAALATEREFCPRCRLPLHGRDATAYLTARTELARLALRRTELLALRDQALNRMRENRAEPEVSAQVLIAPKKVAATEAPAPKPERDLSHHAVQNVLLVLGGLLLSIAAIVFTLVSWRIPALRALILIVFTLAVLAAPWLLVRRRLSATAETVALIGLVLIPLDAVAVIQALDKGPYVPGQGTTLDPLWGVSLGSAALAVLWAGYAWRAPLRLPGPTVLVLLQLPLPVAGWALSADTPLAAWAPAGLVATAVLDLVAWRSARRAGAAIEYVTAAVAGSLAWVAGLLVTAYLTVELRTETVIPANEDPVWHLVDASGMAVVLAAATAPALAWAVSTRDHRGRTMIMAGAGLAAVGALVVVPVMRVPYLWQVAVAAGAACVVLAAAGLLSVRLATGLRVAGGLVLAATAAFTVLDVLVTVLGPFTWIQDVWGARPGTARQLLAWTTIDWYGTPATPLVLGACVLGALLVPPGPLWTRQLRSNTAVVSAALAVATVPVAAELPHRWALGLLVAASAALLVLGSRRGGGTVLVLGSPRGGGIVLWLGAYGAALVMCWALADRLATALVPAALFPVLAGCAVAARNHRAQAVGGFGATAAASVLAWALLAQAGVANEWPGLSQAVEPGLVVALALLGIRAVAQLLTRPSRKLARAVVQARTVRVTLALGLVDRLTRAAGPGARLASEVAASLACLLALAAPQQAPSRLALVLAIAALVAAWAAWRRPRGWWRTVAVVEACVLAAAALVPLGRSVVPALVGPYGWIDHAWRGADAGARDALTPASNWAQEPLLLPVLMLAVTAAMLAVAAHWGRPAALGVARIALPLLATTLPVVADLPYWIALVFLVALTAGLALWSAVSRSAAGGASLWTATLAVSWSLAEQTATLAVLGAIAVTGLLCAIRGKGSPVTSVAASVTGLAVGAESVAAALGGGLGEGNAALILLMVAVLLSRAAALRGLPTAAALPLGGSAGVLWLVSVGLALNDDVVRLSIVLAVGSLALVAAAGRLPSAYRPLAVMAAGVASMSSLLPHVEVWSSAVGTPFDAFQHVWDGPPGFLPHDAGTALAVGAIVAVSAVLAARGLGGGRAALTCATIAVPLCLVLVPFAGGLPYSWSLVFYGGVLVALAVQAARGLSAAGWAAAIFALYVAVWGLWSEPHTLLVLGGLALLAAGCALAGRTAAARAGGAAAATLAFGAEAAAAGLSAGLTAEQTAFVVLAAATVAVSTAAAIARNGQPRVALAVEAPAWVLAVVALLLALNDLELFSLALAGAGALLLAQALRPDRRGGAWLGLALLQLALWLELLLRDVDAPEAYTAPLSLGGLVAAWLFRRRDPAVSSWIGYGTALAFTFLPSLYAAWNDPGLVRPLLLGTAAFAATLAGAWGRLQAPLLLGGAVLVVTAAHEFAPALADFVSEGPRWLPIAIAGAFLLFTGATYEHRLRDLRRVRGLIVRMR